MKNKMLQISSLLFLVLTLAVVSVKAQGVVRLKGHIPFDFNVGNKNYKAEDYSITLENPSKSPATMIMQDAKGSNLQIGFIQQSGKRSLRGKTTLTFNRYNDQYFLAEIASPDFGLSILKSKVEQRIARKFRQRNFRPERVAVT